MKTIYNIDNKICVAEPSPIGSFVLDAKRNQNFVPLRRRTQPHSLWRYLSHSSVLQKVETEVAFANFRNYSNGDYSSSCKVSQIATQKHTQIASGVYLQTNTRSYYSEN